MMKGAEKPKYQKLKDYIIDTIKSQELKPGDKILSENELAGKFDISRHTVRQAIGELTGEGWLYKAQGKGTFVDRRPDKSINRSKTVGVITTYLNDYIFPSIIRGIDGVLEQSGYNIILGCTYNRHERERLCLENMKERNVAGLIVETTKSALPNPNLELYRELSGSGVPILFIHGFYKELNYSSIVEDDIKAGYLAANHLTRLGHHKIGGIFKIDDIQGHYRFMGFQKAYAEAKIVFVDSRVLWFDTDETDIKFKSGGAKQLERILSDCTAVVCYNDQISVKVMDIIREKGLSIPKDISIVSFDDSQLAVASEIKLTTVAHPKEKLGLEAAEAIIKMIERKKNYFSIKMQPELVVRGSTQKYE